MGANLHDVTTAEDMASRQGILPPEQAARLTDAFRPVNDLLAAFAEATRPTTEALASIADQLGEATAALRGGLIPLPAQPIPESVLRHFRRWGSMSPRQRARALLAEVRKRAGSVARAYAASLRTALGRTLDNLAALVSGFGRIPTDADPPDGPPLALVLLDSTRPVHGPPLPA